MSDHDEWYSKSRAEKGCKNDSQDVAVGEGNWDILQAKRCYVRRIDCTQLPNAPNLLFQEHRQDRDETACRGFAALIWGPG